MPRLFLAIVFCLLTALGPGAIQRAHSQVSLVDSIINPIALRELVQVLASDSLKGRFTGSEHAVKAAIFIADEFKKAGALPVDGNEGYFEPFVAPGPAKVGINVMAAIPGNSKADELIIFSAHYDHVGTESSDPYRKMFGDDDFPRGDTIFNGANDNASGVAAIIRLAYYFGELKNNERTIVFIAFSGEELGLLGSQTTATKLNPETIKAVINIEMIGRSISKKKKNAYITGSFLSDLQQILNRKLYETSSGLYGKNFFSNDRFPSQRLFYRSDNYWFARRGIPAHTIMSSSPADRYYHSPNDEISTLNFNLMSDLVRAIAKSCSGLVAGTDTPLRIIPNRIEDR